MNGISINVDGNDKFEEMMAESDEIAETFGSRENIQNFPSGMGKAGGQMRGSSSNQQNNMVNSESENKLSLNLPTNFYSNLRRDYRFTFFLTEIRFNFT